MHLALQFITSDQTVSVCNFLLTHSLWSYPLPNNSTYEDHIIRIKNHISHTFQNTALVIDYELLQQASGQTDQTSLASLYLAKLPEALRIHIQQSQFGSIPSFVQSHNRTCSIWRQNHPSVSGTGGGVLTPKTAILPHHKTWIEQQSQHPNPVMPTTCQLPIHSDIFFTTYLSNDIDNVYMVIPFCPDTNVLSSIQSSTDVRDIKQLSSNLLRQQELTTNLQLPLDQIESYIRTVTSSLGGEMLKYDKTMLSLLQISEFNSSLLQTFTINKDVFVFLPGNNILITIGRVQIDNRFTNTIVVEMELLQFTTLALDPLVFHHIFNLIHPLSDSMLWKYANSPFSPSKNYTIHDLCPTPEQLESLKLIYNQSLLPALPGSILIPTLKTDYTYPRPAHLRTKPTTTQSSSQLSTPTPATTTITSTTQELDNDEEELVLDNPPPSIISTPEENLEQQKRLVAEHVPLDFNQYAYPTTDPSGPRLSNYIQGTCIIPSMSTTWEQYRLHQSTFHLEHLALMYTHLFLHPHESAI